MLIDRLIFGTARLPGGANRRAAERLLDIVFKSGIHHVDTAPTYGMGTTEGVVGRVLARQIDIAVTVKVGLPHPRHGYAKSWGRRLKRGLRPSISNLSANFTPPLEPEDAPAKGDYDPVFMTRSFERSCRALQREVVDLLLLHEAYAGDARRPTLEWLAEQQRQGRARAVGFSHGKGFGPRADAAFPADYVAQCAVNPAWFKSGALGLERSVVLHSIVQTVDWMIRTDAATRVRLERAASGLGGSKPSNSALIAAGFAILHHRMPAARFVFATTDETRLRKFLDCVRHTEAIGVEAIALRFDELGQ